MRNPVVVILVVLLVIACLGGLPTWGYHDYGYWPSGLIGILVLLLVLRLLGVI